jgi:hypothetical protein
VSLLLATPSNLLAATIQGVGTLTSSLTTSITMASTINGAATVTATIPLIPTLVQRVAYGALFSGQGLSATNFTIRIPNKVKQNNCVILFMDYNAALSVSTITDDAGNTWSNTPAVSANGGAGNMKTEAYVLPGANASGAQAFTITFSGTADTAHFLLLEYCNLKTTSVIGTTASTTTATAPTITTSAISPSSGNLVLHYSMQNANIIGQAGTTTVTSWTAGSGWALEAADYATGNSGGPVDMNAYALQTRIAPGGSITPSMTTSGTNRYSSIALELLTAATVTGTPAPAPSLGIYVKRMQYFLNTNIDVNPWNEPFPCDGNLLAMVDIQGIVQSAPTDSKGNTWSLPVTGSQNAVVALAYAASATTGPDTVLHIPIAGSPARNTTVVVYDITGAHATPYAQSVVAAAASFSTNFTQPTITPINTDAVILTATAIGIGPLTGLTSPTGALFLPVTYPGETDFDTFNNADGYAIRYNGASLASQSYTWVFPNAGGLPQSAYSTAVEFKSTLVSGGMAAAIHGVATVTTALTTSITAASTINGVATVTSALTTQITAASTINGVATVTANPLNTQITAAATINGVATVSAALTTSITAASTINGVATVSGSLTTKITPAATINGVATVLAALTTQITPNATINGVATVISALTTQITMASTINGVATVSAALTTQITPNATINGVATVTSALTTSITAASTINGVATVTPVLSTQITPNATINGVATVLADLITNGSGFNTTINGVATVAAALTTQITAAATINGVATVTPVLSTQITPNATINGVATVTANPLNTQITAAATINGVATLNSSLTTQITASSTITGVASVTASPLNTSITMASTIVGAGALAAALTTSIQLAATINESATVTSALTTQITPNATINGRATFTANFPSSNSDIAASTHGQANVAADLLTNIALSATCSGGGGVVDSLDTHINLAATIGFIVPDPQIVYIYQPGQIVPQSCKCLVKSLELPLPDSLTSSLGIFQSDVIIRTAIVAAIADLRANPWLLDYVFASLPKDSMTMSQYGEQEVSRAKEWFLGTDIPVIMYPNLDAAKLPCISISLLESSENAATVGDIHYEPSEETDAGWPVLFGPFTPSNYNAGTGVMQINANGFELMEDIQCVVDSKGNEYPITETYDDNTFAIAAGTVADFTDATIRSPKPAFVAQLESIEFKESYNLGSHVQAEPVHLTYLHSILTFILLRYKLALLDVRGFTRSVVSASDFQLNGQYGKENVFSRFTTLTGYVRQYWPGSVNPKIAAIATQLVVENTDHVAAGDSVTTSTWIGDKDQS